MSYKVYSILYRLLKHKYNAPLDATYMESIEIMKRNGITNEELEALHEAWKGQLPQ